jgi:hypothetical protein
VGGHHLTRPGVGLHVPASARTRSAKEEPLSKLPCAPTTLEEVDRSQEGGLGLETVVSSTQSDKGRR